MNNKEIAHIFRTIADILEIKDENFFRIRAYRTAAQNIENLTEDISVLIEDKKLKIPGVGADLKAKIEEMTTTGRLSYYEQLKKTIPAGVLEIMTIPGVGPKTTKLLYEKLKIDSIDTLEKAAKTHKISGLYGIKEKTEENILNGIALIKQGHERVLLSTATEIGREIVAVLKKLKEVKQISVAGSLRRKKETVRDIDILVTSTQPEKVMNVFTKLPLVNNIVAQGKTKSVILTAEGIQVDLRVVDPVSFGAALCYFTGSKEHNIRMRELAKRRGLKINEYGVFDEKTEKRIAGKTEKSVYETLGFCFIEPELRENSGELEAAAKNNLPKLVAQDNIHADVHIHSTWSDGAFSILEMAQVAQARGYEFIVISDHSQSLGIAGGLKPAELLKQIEQIKTLNRKFRNFKILSGAEVDIKSDGRLDFDDHILEKLDFVLAAIHSGFKQSKDQITMRIVKAMKNKYVNIIAHPFGRLINERPAYDFDFEEVLKTAKKTNTAFEINCYPKRLDLDYKHARRAKDSQVALALGTDSHTIEQMSFMEFGVSVARGGWLEKKDLLNCLSYKEFLKRIKK